eukprot:753453-Hanusia_phi.AAC.4
MQDKRAMRRRCVPGVELLGSGGRLRVVASKGWSPHEVIGELCGVLSHGCERNQSQGPATLTVGFDVQGNELNFLRHCKHVQAQDGVALPGNCEVVLAVIREFPSLLVVSRQEVLEGSELILNNSEYSSDTNIYQLNDHDFHISFSLSSSRTVHAPMPFGGGEQEGSSTRSAWPADLKYSVHPSLSKQDKEQMRRRRLPGVSVLRVQQTDHPAFGQFMLCAKRRWSAGEVLGEYTGNVGRDLHTGEYVACLVNPYASCSFDRATDWVRGGLGGILEKSVDTFDHDRSQLALFSSPAHLSDLLLKIDASARGNEMRMINDYR